MASAKRPLRRLPWRNRVTLDPSCGATFLASSSEAVLSNCATHSTTSQQAEAILRSRTFRGSFPKDRRYDGGLQLPAAYFSLHPQSDQVVLPYSTYPKEVPGGDPIKIVTIDLSFVATLKHSVFYIATTPTQVGAKFLTVYRSHLTAVAEEMTDDLANLSKEYIKLDMRRNRILQFDDDNNASFSTKVTIDGRTYPHSVLLSFVNELHYPKDFHLGEIDARKVSFLPRESHDKPCLCPHPDCAFACSGLRQLKDHYRAVHLKLKAYECVECGRGFSTNSYRNAHVRTVHHGEKKFECLECGKSFSQKGSLSYHTKALHTNRKQTAVT